MDIMNVLRTGMNMSISHIHVWQCNTPYSPDLAGIDFHYFPFLQNSMNDKILSRRSGENVWEKTS